MNILDFSRNGPQLAEEKYGPEPTLHEMIFEYYLKVFNREEAEKLTEEYINAVISKDPG